jgi:hypothetical protein
MLLFRAALVAVSIPLGYATFLLFETLRWVVINLLYRHPIDWSGNFVHALVDTPSILTALLSGDWRNAGITGAIFDIAILGLIGAWLLLLRNEEEFELLLKKHEVDYDPKYVFD